MKFPFNVFQISIFNSFNHIRKEKLMGSSGSFLDRIEVFTIQEATNRQLISYYLANETRLLIYLITKIIRKTIKFNL